MAYEITWDDVLDTAIAQVDLFGLFTESQQRLIIDLVNAKVQESRFFEFTKHARRFLAAHFAAISVGPTAGEGTISNQTIGSISYGVTLAVNNPKADENLLSTAYGREYFEIFKMVSISVYVP